MSYLYYKYDESNKYGKWYKMRIIRLPRNNNLINTSLIKTFQMHFLDNELNSGFKRAYLKAPIYFSNI